MEGLPGYVYLIFGLTLAAALFLFYQAARSSKRFLLIVGLWIAGQSALSLGHFYEHLSGFPPRLPLLLLPPLVMTSLLFATRRGRRFLDGLAALAEPVV